MEYLSSMLLPVELGIQLTETLFTRVRVSWIMMSHRSEGSVEGCWRYSARLTFAGQGQADTLVALIWKDPPPDLFRQSFLTFPHWEIYVLASRAQVHKLIKLRSNISYKQNKLYFDQVLVYYVLSSSQPCVALVVPDGMHAIHCGCRFVANVTDE